MKAKLLEIEYGYKMELEKIKAQTRDANLERQWRQRHRKISVKRLKTIELRNKRVEQSKLISQRQGKRGELEEDQTDDLLSQIFDAVKLIPLQHGNNN